MCRSSAGPALPDVAGLHAVHHSPRGSWAALPNSTPSRSALSSNAVSDNPMLALPFAGPRAPHRPRVATGLARTRPSLVVPGDLDRLLFGAPARHRHTSPRVWSRASCASGAIERFAGRHLWLRRRDTPHSGTPSSATCGRGGHPAGSSAGGIQPARRPADTRARIWACHLNAYAMSSSWRDTCARRCRPAAARRACGSPARRRGASAAVRR